MKPADWVFMVSGILVAALIVLLLSTARSRGQEHFHHAQDAPIHEQFYSTWFMPDQPTKSCCNLADCYPVERVEWRNGELYAMRREDGRMIHVPQQKIEHNRDNPDGRSHMCAPPPNRSGDQVYCFTLGGGA